MIAIGIAFAAQGKRNGMKRLLTIGAVTWPALRRRHFE